MPCPVVVQLAGAPIRSRLPSGGHRARPPVPGHLLDGRAELLRDPLQVTQTQVDQGVRAGVAGVLGQEQPYRASGDRHECREAGLEAVFPLLGETQALIPGGGHGGVADPKDRDDFLLHGLIVSPIGRHAWGVVRC